MSDRISIGEGALARGAQAAAGAHIDIYDSTRRVLDELDELSANWTGDAAVSYAALVTEWSHGADKLNLVLTQLENALRATDRDQQATEEQHGKTIGGLSAILGGE